MSIDPQYTYDKLGNPIGVFLPIEEWNTIARELHLEIPTWEKEFIDIRLAEYDNNPTSTLDWNDVVKKLDKEDGAI